MDTYLNEGRNVSKKEKRGLLNEGTNQQAKKKKKTTTTTTHKTTETSNGGPVVSTQFSHSRRHRFDP